MAEFDNNENPELTPSDDFNEKIEIEKLQEKIKRISEFNNTTQNSDEGQNSFTENQQFYETDTPIDEEELVSFMESRGQEEEEKEIAPKKFVVTADVPNVEYFDKLSVNERSDLFNELLSAYIKNEDMIKGKRRLKRLALHIVIAVVTFVIALPLAFYLVNKSIHLTVQNYKGAQANFEKLYESRGVMLETRKKHRH